MNEKYELLQHFNDDDLLLIKQALKGKKEDNQNRKQFPAGFFFLFAVLAFVAYIQEERLAMLLYILASIVSAMAVYYVNYIDDKGVTLYRFMFAKCLFERIMFMQNSMNCIHEQEEMLQIAYHQINKVYELESMLILKNKDEQVPYIFILKRDLSLVAYDCLKNEFGNRWQKASNNHFILR